MLRYTAASRWLNSLAASTTTSEDQSEARHDGNLSRCGRSRATKQRSNLVHAALADRNGLSAKLLRLFNHPMPLCILSEKQAFNTFFDVKKLCIARLHPARTRTRTTRLRMLFSQQTFLQYTFQTQRQHCEKSGSDACRTQDSVGPLFSVLLLLQRKGLSQFLPLRSVSFESWLYGLVTCSGSKAAYCDCIKTFSQPLFQFYIMYICQCLTMLTLCLVRGGTREEHSKLQETRTL